MNKKTMSALAVAVLLAGSVSAQSITDGINALNAGNYKEAENIFQKNNAGEGQYWVYRSYADQGDMAKARAYANQAIAAHPADPYTQILKGELAYLDGKTAEGNQLMQAVITGATGKKGIDPSIANAVGRSINNAYSENKSGNLQLGIQALTAAVNAKPKDNWLLSNLYTELGEMQMNANPGDGGPAFQNFINASTTTAAYPRAYMKQALIFKSQKNYATYMEYLTKATDANPKYLPAWYEQYYYWLGTGDYESALKIASRIKENLPAGDLNSDYMTASTLYLNKQYDQAIQAANSLIAKAGNEANPDAYKLIAWSYLDKKDTLAAIPFVDKYFEKVKKADIDAKDYTLKANAYAAKPGSEAVIYQTFVDAAAAQKDVPAKLDVLADAEKFFNARGNNLYRGEVLAKIIDTKPSDKLTLNDFFNAGYYGFYKAGEYEKSWNVFDKMRTRFPDQNYGYLWAFNNSKIFDSTNARNIVLPDAEKLVQFSLTDTSAQAKANAYSAAQWLGIYYYNEKKDKVNSAKYLKIAADNAPTPTAKNQMEGLIKTVSGSK